MNRAGAVKTAGAKAGAGKPVRRRGARLLPLVIAAATGLLGLKVLGLVLQGGYILNTPGSAGADFTRSLNIVRGTEARRDILADTAETTGSTPPKKDEKKDAKKDDDKKVAATQPLPPVAPPPPAGPSAAERETLEKLMQRRQQLEERAKELEMRELLLQSAEKLMQERLSELARAETRADVDGRGKGQAADGQMKGLVSMYEAMKPRDAARVFEKLEPRKLAQLAGAMNPRKLSEVLAAMSPDAAEKLTAMLMPQTAEKPAAPARAGDAAPKPEMQELERLPLPPQR